MSMGVFNLKTHSSSLCYLSCRIFNASQWGAYYCVCALDNSGWATLLTTQIGFGGTLGFLLGYGLKKVAAILLKIAALIAGLFMLALTWLASIGVITINFNVFTATMENNMGGAISALVGSLAFAAQVVPMGGSFGLGFYLGAKKG